MHIYIFTSLRTALFFGHFWSMVSVFLRGSILIGIGHLITRGGGPGHSHSAYVNIHIYIVTDGTIFRSFLVNGQRFFRGIILIGIGHLITGGGGPGHSHSAYAYIHIYIVTDGTIFWSFLVNG